MSNAAAINAGGAFVRLMVKDETSKGLAGVLAKLKGFGGAVALVGAAAGGALVGALTDASKVFVDFGSEMAGLSARTGVSVEALSALSYAAGQSGVDMEGLEHGLRHMQRTLGEAAGGSKEAQAHLAQLGLTVRDLAAMTPDQQFEAIAEAISKVANPTSRAALAMEIFGRSGTELLPLLNKGAAGMEALKARAAELGLVMSGQDAAAAKEFKHHMLELETRLKMLAFKVGSLVLPALEKLWDLGKKALSGLADAVVDYATPAFDALRERFPDLFATFDQTWSGITAAVASGDLAGAANIAWLGIKVGFLQATEGIMDAWDQASAWVQGVWIDTSAWLQTQFVTVRIFWEEVTAAMSEDWNALVGDLAALWEEWGPTVVAVWDAVWAPIQAGWETMKAGWTSTVGLMSDLWDEWSDRVIAALGQILNALALVSPEAAAALASLQSLADSNLGQHLQNAVARAGGEEGQGERDRIEQERQQAQEENTAALGESATGRKDALQKAKDDLAAAVAAAGQARPGLPAVAAGISPMAFTQKADVAGTFSGAAAGRMGFGESLSQKMLSALDRIADASEETAAGVGGLGELG
jgi:hypothetical protein